MRHVCVVLNVSKDLYGKQQSQGFTSHSHSINWGAVNHTCKISDWKIDVTIRPNRGCSFHLWAFF